MFRSRDWEIYQIRRCIVKDRAKNLHQQPPRVVSSRAGQKGGCGVEGRQDLKTTTPCDDCVDITPPFRADPHELGTMLFEEGEDDMGTEEEVKPNFRTPPR
jgi:hypothetical protein